MKELTNFAKITLDESLSTVVSVKLFNNNLELVQGRKEHA